MNDFSKIDSQRMVPTHELQPQEVQESQKISRDKVKAFSGPQPASGEIVPLAVKSAKQPATWQKLSGVIMGIQAAMQPQSLEVSSRLQASKDPLEKHHLTQLGKGAFGVVYKAVLDGLHTISTILPPSAGISKELALKYYLPTSSADDISQEANMAMMILGLNMFEREFHHYVPKVHGILDVEGKPVIVMKYCNLGGLDKAIEKIVQDLRNPAGRSRNADGSSASGDEPFYETSSFNGSQVETSTNLPREELHDIYDTLIVPDTDEPVDAQSLTSVDKMENALDQHLLEAEDRFNIFIGYQVLDILSKTHRAGILHHDVRADNFMAHRKKNGMLQVLIGDFGLASKKDAGSRIPDKIDIAHAPPEMDIQKLRTNRADADLLAAWNSEKYDSYMAGLTLLSIFGLPDGERIWRGHIGSDRNQWTDLKKTFNVDEVTIIPSTLKPIIKGLLDPNPESRWTVSQAREEMAKDFPHEITHEYLLPHAGKS